MEQAKRLPGQPGGDRICSAADVGDMRNLGWHLSKDAIVLIRRTARNFDPATSVCIV